MTSNSATVPCAFCSTLNSVKLDRIGDRPKCGKCARPILLDRPLKLNESDFDRVVHDASIPVVVDFYADWCAPCRAMAPTIDEVAHEHSGRLLVAKLDTDRNQNLAARFNIRGIPTVIVFENGVEKIRRSGVMRREEIEQLCGTS